jgi:hypothetical protein
MRRVPLGTVVLAVFLAAQAPAQDEPAASRPAVRREGFIWGFYAGSGFSSVYRPTFGAFAGGMARPNLGLALEACGIGKADDRTHTLIGATLQYWPASRVWIKGGVGYGLVEDDTEYDYFDRDGNFVYHPKPANEARVGGLAAAGYEIIQSGRFTVDAQVRTIATTGDGGTVSTAFSFGLSWY